MKQKDIATIVFIVVISVVVSVFVSQFVISSPKNRQQKVEMVEVVSSEFTRPSDTYFNSKAINPTQTITIGGNNNTKPFGN